MEAWERVYLSERCLLPPVVTFNFQNKSWCLHIKDNSGLSSGIVHRELSIAPASEEDRVWKESRSYSYTA